MITGAVVSATTAGVALGEAHMDVAARHAEYTEHLHKQVGEVASVADVTHFSSRLAMP